MGLTRILPGTGLRHLHGCMLQLAAFCAAPPGAARVPVGTKVIVQQQRASIAPSAAP
jgi:hypothetical protein